MQDAGWALRNARVLLFASCLLLLARGGKAAPPAAPVITVEDATGVARTPLAADGRKATVLLFLMHDCPVANASSPAIARLAADFEPRGVKFFGVYATETAREITTHRESYKLPFPGLLDPQCQLARHAGATRVPEAAVFSSSGQLLYRGRIDDRATQPGSLKPQPSREDLRLALEAILAGKPAEPRFTKVVGCYLPL
jgi:peroxiredoxin